MKAIVFYDLHGVEVGFFSIIECTGQMYLNNKSSRKVFLKECCTKQGYLKKLIDVTFKKVFYSQAILRNTVLNKVNKVK